MVLIGCTFIGLLEPTARTTVVMMMIARIRNTHTPEKKEEDIPRLKSS